MNTFGRKRVKRDTSAPSLLHSNFHFPCKSREKASASVSVVVTPPRLSKVLVLVLVFDTRSEIADDTSYDVDELAIRLSRRSLRSATPAALLTLPLLPSIPAASIIADDTDPERIVVRLPLLSSLFCCCFSSHSLFP